LTEDLVDQIDDDYESSALPDRYKSTIRAVDAMIHDPASVDDRARAGLRDAFTPPETVELLVTAALASAFSKAAIAWGPPPDMPTTDAPTPTADPSKRYA
jgi:alkylhydroperoxidase family enzyme